jgi:hypothetical protein
LAAVTGYTIVTGRIQDADTSEAELQVLVALALLVSCGQIGFVVAI